MTQSRSSSPDVLSSVPDAGPTAQPRAEDVVAFPDGLPGFESCHGFVLASAGDRPVSVLQAVEPPHPSFLVIDPAVVMSGYRKILSRPDRLRLQAAADDAMLWLAVVTLGPDGTASVNLRAPIVINPRTMIGFQVMPHQSLYPLRHPITL